MALLSFLRAYGVEPVATPLHVASIFWHHMTAFGGIDILVPRHQAGVASDLLASVQARESESASRSRRASAGRGLLAVLVWLLFTVPPPATGFFPRRPIRSSCGHETA